MNLQCLLHREREAHKGHHAHLLPTSSLSSIAPKTYCMRAGSIGLIFFKFAEIKNPSAGILSSEILWGHGRTSWATFRMFWRAFGDTLEACWAHKGGVWARTQFGRSKRTRPNLPESAGICPNLPESGPKRSPRCRFRKPKLNHFLV